MNDVIIKNISMPIILIIAIVKSTTQIADRIKPDITTILYIKNGPCLWDFILVSGAPFLIYFLNGFLQRQHSFLPLTFAGISQVQTETSLSNFFLSSSILSCIIFMSLWIFSSSLLFAMVSYTFFRTSSGMSK